MVCQEDAGELRCSLDSKSGNAKQSDESLAKRILKYKSFKDLPALMNLDQFKDGRDLGQSLFYHGAKHHKNATKSFQMGKYNEWNRTVRYIALSRTTTKSLMFHQKQDQQQFHLHRCKCGS